eukprot:gene10004-biopygen1623
MSGSRCSTPDPDIQVAALHPDPDVRVWTLHPDPDVFSGFLLYPGLGVAPGPGYPEVGEVGDCDGVADGAPLGPREGVAVGDLDGAAVISSHVWFATTQSGTHTHPDSQPQVQRSPTPA